MEGLTRLVSESLARHGFDRPLDYRRLQWSRWFRCDSHHSLLFVPSKPGVFALAEEVMDFGQNNDYVETPAKPALSAVEGAVTRSEASGVPWTKPEADSPRRMLAVTQFFEDEDMAFVLDRMVSRPNSMNARLDLRPLLRPLRRDRRPDPASQHLQRPQSVDRLRRRKGDRHWLPFRHFPGTDPSDRIRSSARRPPAVPFRRNSRS